MATLRNFGQDLAFLRDHVETIVLENSPQQRIVVVPDWQGRTMTSTATGDGGLSYGWVNYDRISSGKIEPQINLFGGEDRFWVSPEGSQYSFFFDPDAPMDLTHWRTPPELDTEPFELTGQTDSQVDFQKEMKLVNYCRTEFDFRVERRVQIKSDEQTSADLGMDLPPGVSSVSHESQNRVTNTGSGKWQARTGLPAVWILCMNKPSDHATILVPFRPGPVSDLGKIVTSSYFGELDSSRLRICEKANLVYFLGDGKLRSKLGISFPRAVPYLGAWDAVNQCMTIVQFNLPVSTDSGYTDNLWSVSEDPYAGDVVNSYNDGPNDSGGMMGPFYELETLSPALALDPQESFTHVHRTIHLEGDRPGLDRIAQHVFGVTLESVECAFPTIDPLTG